MEATGNSRKSRRKNIGRSAYSTIDCPRLARTLTGASIEPSLAAAGVRRRAWDRLVVDLRQPCMFHFSPTIDKFTHYKNAYEISCVLEVANWCYASGASILARFRRTGPALSFRLTLKPDKEAR